MNYNKINNVLQGNGADWINWRYNPASHMGGVWEHQIQTARNILEEPFQAHSLSLNGESLRNLMTEVELIANSRPLTVESLNDANSPTPISPTNLLTLRSSVVMPPPGEFNPLDLYSKKARRLVQHIAEEF